MGRVGQASGGARVSPHDLERVYALLDEMLRLRVSLPRDGALFALVDAAWRKMDADVAALTAKSTGGAS